MFILTFDTVGEWVTSMTFWAGTDGSVFQSDAFSVGRTSIGQCAWINTISVDTSILWRTFIIIRTSGLLQRS